MDFPKEPLQALCQLPQPILDWHETDIIREQWRQGLDPDYGYFWNSLTRSQQWQLVAMLLDLSLPKDMPCPKVTLTKRAAPLRTTALRSQNDDLNYIPSSGSSGNLKLFDLNNLIIEDKRSLHPHAGWLCNSGWGKDYTSSQLIAKADGEIIACLIKDPEIWRKNCPQARIICNGYDVSEIEKVLQEVCDRNESRMLNHEPKTPLTVVLSDYPSITDGIKDITEKYIGKILRDARSNCIRFWFLIQEGNVAALKLEGRSDLLKNITLIRGGDFALEHGLSLLKTGLLAKQDIQFLNGCDRPCIVGNTLAQI